MSKEADIENAFVKYAEQLGCLALKLRMDNRNGFPDRTILTPKGVFFIEFKRPGGQLSYHQRNWISRIRKLGFKAFVFDNVEDAVTKLNEILGVE